MICHNCGFENDSDAVFCESCGKSVSEAEASPREKKSGLKSRYADIFENESELNDVIFTPKTKRSSPWIRIFLGFSLVVFIIFALLVYEESSSSEAPTYSPAPQVSTFQLHQLALENLDSKFIGQAYYLTGTVVNNSDKFLEDIYLRVDFFRNENQTGLFDTRFISVDILAPRAAYSFEELMNISPPTDEWWWVMTVEDATVME